MTEKLSKKIKAAIKKIDKITNDTIKKALQEHQG